MKIVGILLAAGESKRYKGNKLVALHESGLPLVRYCATQLTNAFLSRSYVVTGRWHSEIVGVMRHGTTEKNTSVQDVQLTYNPQWYEGMGTSLRWGVQQALAAYSDITHVLVTLGDLAKVTDDHLTMLLRASESNPTKLICSCWQSNGERRYTVPAIFPANAFPALLALTGDMGAKSVIRQWRNTNDVIGVSLPEAEFDIDTPSDWQK
jgi:molybdenum cofactor cytidylyltransferase